METQHNLIQPESFVKRHKHIIKGIMISVLILALLIPTKYISDLVSERQQRNQTVKNEIAKQWSQSQTVCGPILVVPYLQVAKEVNGKEIVTKSNTYFMPDKLTINGELIPSIKNRSIFKVPIYNAKLDIDGSFAPLDIKALSIPQENMLFGEATLVFGITDMKGLQEQTQLRWDKETLPWSIGNSKGLSCNGSAYEPLDETSYQQHENHANATSEALSVAIPIDATSLTIGHQFSMKLNLRGTEHIYFAPIGTTTKVNVKANWKDRDFIGNYVPDSSTLSNNGFAANWNVYRSVMPQYKNSISNLNRTTFGVNLIQPLDNYGKTNRTIKYAILVIMLTFVVYFFIEVFQKKNVHAIQYILIGFALCIFYTLLLSIAEYMSFAQAYIIAALATVLLIGLYTKSVFNNIKTAGIFTGFLSMLYVFIFILIQLQDGALLTGSIGLFMILAAIMYFSRKIEWNTK